MSPQVVTLLKKQDEFKNHAAHKTSLEYFENSSWFNFVLLTCNTVQCFLRKRSKLTLKKIIFTSWMCKLVGENLISDSLWNFIFMTFIPIDLRSRKQTNKTYILLLKTFWSLILFCTGETSDRLETAPIQAIKMNNLSSNSTQAALRKEICRLSQYETWPSVDAESLGIQQIFFCCD